MRNLGNLFIEKSSIPHVSEKVNILKNLELLEDSRLKNAGVLLFCKKVTKFFLNAAITCVLFQGKDKNKILDRKEFDSDIYSNYQETISYLKSKLNTEYIIKGGPREEVLELPENALREALLNAIAPRNYFLNANIQVQIYQDRIEITNPGGLVSGMKITDLGKRSLSRNNLLFGLMQRMSLVEKVGSGILRIKNAMREYHLKEPRFEVDENWFTIIFCRPDLQKASLERRKGVEKGVEKLSKNEETIIALIKENKYVSKEEMFAKGRLTKKAVEYNIGKLKRKGVLRRVGPDKGGYWDVIEK